MSSVLIVFFFISLIPGGILMDLLKFLRCAGGDAFTCPVLKLFIRLNQMLYYKCANCDRYFHCQGSFDAVYLCGINTTENARITKKSE